MNKAINSGECFKCGTWTLAAAYPKTLCGQCEADDRNQKRRDSEKAQPGSLHRAGWGAWVRHPWDVEDPRCVRCGAAMSKKVGYDWGDFDELNLCRECAIDVLCEMRPNEGAKERCL